MTKLTVDESRINDWLADQRDNMLGLLAEVVNLDSGTYNKAGVDQVGERFAAFFASHHVPVSRQHNDTFGDCFRASVEGRGPGPGILLMGHRDTVFPSGEASRRPFTINGERAYGPGVADMKAGLVMNAFLLAAFNSVGQLSRPLVALFTADEEIGSPSSRALIEAEARQARFVLNSEPGRVSGNVVSERSGGVFLQVDVRGRAAHSGANFRDGISAIEELAHKILALHALTDFDRGTTVNVGLVRGGQSVNTTAPQAEGQIDLRYRLPIDRERAMAAMERIVGECRVPGASASMSIIGEFLPLLPSASGDLLRVYRAAAEDVGLILEGERTGGCADSGFPASIGVPTLCGLGPVGGKAHSPDEYIEVDSIIPRTQAAALTIARLDRAGSAV
jgi:glutamate carboxypeptidase